MVTLVNRAKVSTSTTGTGTITLGAAADGYQTFADAGVTDGQTVRYVIEDGSNWEIGTGVYTASGTTLSRTVSESSNSDAAINLSGTATVFVGATAEDFVQAGPSLQAVASGALSDGSAVVINADGTVSVIAAGPDAAGTPVVFAATDMSNTSSAYDSINNKVVIAYRDFDNSLYGTAVVGTVSGTSISFGTPVVFESANNFLVPESMVFDSANNKIVIAYTDSGNSSFGTAVVGTVSGTSISFGTPVVFESAGVFNYSACFDNNSNKVVISYQDSGNSNFGTAIVGTVSGTSISFGTPVVFRAGSTSSISSAFDNNSNKVVIAHRGGSNFGTAIVGTVSGTSISFGTAVVFESANTVYTQMTFDSNSNKVVIVYSDGGNLSYGTAIVGTVSGTSISFGTAVVYASAAIDTFRADFDSNSNKVVISYRNVANSNYGTAIVGTVSGTSISFDTPIVFESAGTLGISSAFDANSKSLVISYQDDDNLDYGTSVVLQIAPTNLTAENFIGFSDASYADTATATIQLVGAVDDAQTSLTAGQKYYVQADGSLSTTPANPEVYAGLAVASNKIIVKG